MEKIKLVSEKIETEQPKSTKPWAFVAVGSMAFLGMDFLPWGVSFLWALGWMAAGAYCAWKELR